MFFYFFLLTIKIFAVSFVFFYGEVGFFGGGNDSEYYHAYALGYTDTVTSTWPTLLRFLNDIGGYSRSGVSISLMVLGFVFIPLMTARLSTVKKSPVKVKVFWLVAVIVSAYPTLFYYATDIYRDVLMVFIFLLGVWAVKSYIEAESILHKFFLFLFCISISLMLYGLRGYLGFGFIIAFLFSGFYSFKKYPIYISLLLFLGFLQILFVMGLLEPLIKYRRGFFDILEGGSNLGIEFGSILMFLPDLLLSIAYQLFGVFFNSLASVAVFIIESIPFAYAFFYIFVNRKYSNSFVDFLIVFFVTYSVIWLLGNDNLGTAVRLRLYNYLSICICFFIVYQNKLIALKFTKK